MMRHAQKATGRIYAPEVDKHLTEISKTDAKLLQQTRLQKEEEEKAANDKKKKNGKGKKGKNGETREGDDD